MLQGYLVLVEDAGNNFSAYAPDLPGCVATGATVDETLISMREAITFHLEGMRQDGEAVPEPHTNAVILDAA